MTSYATSLSFCLKAAGAANEIGDAQVLACLSTLPFGCTYIELADGAPGRFRIGGPSVDTHEGIDLALKAIGWSAFEWHSGTDQADVDASHEAVSILREGLARFGTVLVGPLDQILSNMLPGATFALSQNPEAGIHVAATGLTADGMITIRHAEQFRSIALTDFLPAWRAVRVEERRGSYGLRTRFEARETIARSTAVARGVPVIRAKLSIDPKGARYWGADGPRVYAGADAIRLLARDLGGKALTQARRDFLSSQASLGCDGCLLAAQFLEEAVKPKAAANMRQHSDEYRHLGGLITEGPDRRREAVVVALRLADLEESLSGDLR